MARTSIRERPDREEVLWAVQTACPACGRMMRLAKALGIERAYWLGHDWSSLVMHKFVRRYPEIVKKLVLVNPFLPGAETRYHYFGTLEPCCRIRLWQWGQR